jgi:hypothetical protein
MIWRSGEGACFEQGVAGEFDLKGVLDPAIQGGVG